MPAKNTGAEAPKILIVGGGYAGFYTAFKLEKLLGKGEAEVTLVDPLPYLTYQPFLPEVVAGSIEARHVVTSHRRHLRNTNIVAGKVTNVDHKKKTATIEVAGLKPYTQKYDQIVVTAGAVSRTFPIPGVADQAIGLKTIEEAVDVRNRILDNFDKERDSFVKVLPRDYARVMQIQQDAIISGYEPDGDEVWTQILEVTNG